MDYKNCGTYRRLDIVVVVAKCIQVTVILQPFKPLEEDPSVAPGDSVVFICSCEVRGSGQAPEDNLYNQA